VGFVIVACRLDRLLDDVSHLVRRNAIGDGILDDPLGYGRRHSGLVRLFDQVLNDVRSDLRNVSLLLILHHRLPWEITGTRTGHGMFPGPMSQAARVTTRIEDC
jgi:hypothetical protein